MKAIAISIAMIFLAATFCGAAQGLTIVSKMTRDDGTTATTTSYVSEDHVRWSAGDAEVIIEGKSGTMTTLDSKKKTYFVTTQKDFEAMAGDKKSPARAAGKDEIDDGLDVHRQRPEGRRLAHHCRLQVRQLDRIHGSDVQDRRVRDERVEVPAAGVGDVPQLR